MKKYVMTFLLISQLFSASVVFAGEGAEGTASSFSFRAIIKSVTDFFQQQQRYIYNKLRASVIKQEVSWYLVFLAFAAGVLVSFTPCVYPMIPITIGVLQGAGDTSLIRGFFSAISYVLGLSVVYSLLGYFSATVGIVFGQWMANPWFSAFTIVALLYVVGSMFGFYELKLPHFFKKHYEVNPQGSYLKTFLFGMVSGTFASPCLTPTLAVLLTFVAHLRNPFLGLLLLFSFSLGLGMILVIIGMFSHSLSYFPRAGQWMDDIKFFMGFVLLAVVVSFAAPLLKNAFLVDFAYAVIAATAAIWLFRKVFHR